MALLDILIEGDPRLRQKAHKIRSVDDSLRVLAADMFETMLDAPHDSNLKPETTEG